MPQKKRYYVFLALGIALLLFEIINHRMGLGDFLYILVAMVGVYTSQWLYSRYVEYPYRWKCPKCSLVIRMSTPGPFYQMKFMHSTTMHHNFPEVMK